MANLSNIDYPIKILHVLPYITLNNGIARFIYNTYKQIDKNVIKFDLIQHNWNNKSYLGNETLENKYKNLGMNVVTVEDPSSNLLKSCKEIKSFFKQNANKYNILHVHTIGSASLFMHYAKKYGLKNIVLHVHTSVYSDNKLKALRNTGFVKINNVLSTHKIACSKLAGEVFFKNYKYDILPNGILIDDFLFNENARKQIRKELNIDENSYVFGTVGRLCESKNLFFMLTIIKNLIDSSFPVKLVLVGDGPLKKEINTWILNNNLKNNIILTGNRADVNKLYSAFDAFIMTTLFEGCPIAPIEAQANGLHCFISDTVTDEIDFSKICYIPINRGTSCWEEIIKKNINKLGNRSCNSKIYNSLFSSEVQTNALINIYKKVASTKQ